MQVAQFSFISPAPYAPKLAPPSSLAALRRRSMPGYDIHRFSPSLVRSLSEHSLVSLSAGANATTGPKSGPRCKRRYVLVRVADDDLVTKPLEGHLATEEDTEQLAALLSEDDVSLSPALSLEASSDAETEDSECSDAGMRTPNQLSRSVSQQQQPQQQQKPGGPCDHCGALESPQWRRGPPAKPMLCNACGTRYRRTNQLGPPVPSTRVTTPAQTSNKKRPAMHASNAAKKARCGPAGVHEQTHKALAAF